MHYEHSQSKATSFTTKKSKDFVIETPTVKVKNDHRSKFSKEEA